MDRRITQGKRRKISNSLRPPCLKVFLSADLHLITDSEVFGWERLQPRMRQRPVAETPESIYADLQVGDYVVHIDHGVGRFRWSGPARTR